MSNQDKTIYVTENKQEFVPEVGGVYRFFKSPKEFWVKGSTMWDWMDGDELEVVAFRKNEEGGDVPIVWNKNHLTGSSIKPSLLKPLKTETDIERERAVDKMLSNVFVDPEHDALITANMVCQQLYDKGYIKPRELSGEQIDVLWQKQWVRSGKGIHTFARAIEKHIKGEDQ